MGQHLTEEDVRQIAEYARIGMDDAEIAAMTVDLNSMIDGLAPLLEFDLEGVEPTFHPIGGLSNVMREDVEVPGFTREEALANAPRQQEGSFLIPSILGAPAEEPAAAEAGADEAAVEQGAGPSVLKQASLEPTCETSSQSKLCSSVSAGRLNAAELRSEGPAPCSADGSAAKGGDAE